MYDTEQAEEKERVSARIGGAVRDFCRDHLGKQFFAEQLRQAVIRNAGITAPASADRILRDERQKGLIDYEVISRSESLYEVIGVIGMDEADMDDLSVSRRAAEIVAKTPLLQTKNKSRSGSQLLAAQLAKESGVSESVLRRTGMVYRRSQTAFAKVLAGEMTIWEAYHKTSPLNGNGKAWKPGAPVSQKQQAGDRVMHERVVDIGWRLEGVMMAFKELDLVSAWRAGPLDSVILGVRKCKKRLLGWERDLIRSKKEAGL